MGPDRRTDGPAGHGPLDLQEVHVHGDLLESELLLQGGALALRRYSGHVGEGHVHDLHATLEREVQERGVLVFLEKMRQVRKEKISTQKSQTATHNLAHWRTALSAATRRATNDTRGG
jgi:hypothetical protein